jgi:uncharacterized DUF497 family protein
LSVTTYVATKQFEWDEAKDRANRVKHGIGFDEAALVFASDHVVRPARTGPDGEVRWKLIGPLKRNLIATIIHTGRDGRIRIISARPAKRKEREIFHGTYRARET